LPEDLKDLAFNYIKTVTCLFLFITFLCFIYVIQNLSSLKEYEIYLIMIKKNIDFLI